MASATAAVARLAFEEDSWRGGGAEAPRSRAISRAERGRDGSHRLFAGVCRILQAFCITHLHKQDSPLQSAIEKQAVCGCPAGHLYGAG